MDRDEILKRNKEANEKDECEQYIKSKARRYGEIGLCAFFILLTFYKMLKGIPTNDTLAIFWGYIGVGFIYNYKFLKTRKALFSAICGMIAAISFTIAYILQTW